MARDSRIVDLGVSFSGNAPGDPNGWSEWWRRADEESNEQAPNDDAQAPPINASTTSHNADLRSNIDGTVSIEVPLRITVSLGGPMRGDIAVRPSREAVVTSGLEALRMPFHDTDYASRKGYDALFLNSPKAMPPIEVPMPAATDTSVLARLSGGGTVLHYQNFSICMHAKRRLALFTASNVTGEAKLRKPELGRDYTRKALGGLRKMTRSDGSQIHVWMTSFSCQMCSITKIAPPLIRDISCAEIMWPGVKLMRRYAALMVIATMSRTARPKSHRSIDRTSVMTTGETWKITFFRKQQASGFAFSPAPCSTHRTRYSSGSAMQGRSCEPGFQLAFGSWVFFSRVEGGISAAYACSCLRKT